MPDCPEAVTSAIKSRFQKQRFALTISFSSGGKPIDRAVSIATYGFESQWNVDADHTRTIEPVLWHDRQNRLETVDAIDHVQVRRQQLRPKAARLTLPQQRFVRFGSTHQADLVSSGSHVQQDAAARIVACLDAGETRPASDKSG